MARLLPIRRLSIAVAGAASLVLVLSFPAQALAQVKVTISGGFSPPYRSALPEFERTSSIAVTTGSGASQGEEPETVGAQPGIPGLEFAGVARTIS